MQVDILAFQANSEPHAQSGAVRFGGLGRSYVLVVFADRPAGLLSHADGSGFFPEARPKLTALSWEEIRLALSWTSDQIRQRIEAVRKVISLPEEPKSCRLTKGPTAPSLF